jgi:hypothetical protein
LTIGVDYVEGDGRVFILFCVFSTREENNTQWLVHKKIQGKKKKGILLILVKKERFL